jgi:hypothetical protein
MAGTLVHDAAVTALQATATITTTANGAWINTGRANVKRIRLQATGAVSGSAHTLDVEIQAADDSSGTNTVSLGKFTQTTATLGTTSKYLDVDVQKPWVRAVLTMGSTSSFAGVTITVEEERYQRTSSDSA